MYAIPIYKGTTVCICDNVDNDLEQHKYQYGITNTPVTTHTHLKILLC